jgi:hypothetical protein
MKHSSNVNVKLMPYLIFKIFAKRRKIFILKIFTLTHTYAHRRLQFSRKRLHNFIYFFVGLLLNVTITTTTLILYVVIERKKKHKTLSIFKINITRKKKYNLFRYFVGHTLIA